MLKSLFVLAIMLISVTIEAQITKTAANELIMNALNNDTTILVYSLNESVGRGESIFTADGEEIRNPYDNAYVYFIDDIPSANWAHSCRYCFVNTTDGTYSMVIHNFYPSNYELFSSIRTMSNENGWHWPYTNYTMPPVAAPNSKLYAVLIAGEPGTHNPIKSWYNLSCVYTALVNKYGFIESNCYGGKSNILVIAPNVVKHSIDNKYHNNDKFGTDLNQNNNTEVYVDDFVDESMFPYSKESIRSIFQNLSGEINTTDSILELTDNDQLFVFLCGHGNTYNNNSYFKILDENNDDIRLYDYELANWVRNIKCAQMTFLIDCCYSGGFIDDIMNDSNAVCKNRVVHTCTDASHEGRVEQHITRNDKADEQWQIVDEFVYYWASAILGYYPILELQNDWLTGPWHQYDSTAIGQFPWNMFDSFQEGNGYSHVGYDVNPDYNHDGIVSMDEAYYFANTLDSYSQSGYFNPYDGNVLGAEYPQASYESTFTQELITLDGYKGKINGEAETGVGHNYILDGDVAVDTDGSLTINSGSTIIGNINGRSIINAGSLSTAVGANNVTFRNVVLENNSGDMFNLSHCVFDSCGTILTYNGPVSLIGNTFNETRIKATTNNPPRSEYCIVISSNTFNNTVSNNTIYLEKIPRCNVSGNIITAGGNGIYINRLDGAYQNYIFSNNIIRYCGGSGFISYASNGKLRNNSITSNGSDGIQSLNLSNLYVRGDSTVTLLHDTQKIQGNDRYQIYATNNSHPHDFRYNWLGGNGTNNDVILYFESNQMQDERPSTIDVYNNCWYPLADNNIPSHLLASGDATFNYLPTWTPTGIDVPGEPGPAERLSRGNSLVENGDYDGARIIFMDIVSDFPESPEAIAAMKALYSVEVGSGGDFSDLKDYYIGLLSDDFLGNTADNLANRCDVEMGNYYDAIEWYEYKIIDTNSTYSERIFAEIDLGDLYLQMDENGDRGIKGKMPEFVPTSKEAHMKHTEHLLSLLPGDMEEGALYDYDQTINHNSTGANLMISPNPTSGEISLSFKFENECNGVVNIFNVLGNVVKKVSLGRLKGGIHEERLDLSDMPDGMYFCSLSTDNENKNIVKIFVRH